MSPHLVADAADAHTRDLRHLARRPWNRLRHAHAGLTSDPADRELHQLRIRAKQARYTVEAVADAVGGRRPHELAAALTELQDVLGAHQDAVVGQAWLRANVSRPGTEPGRAYAAGMLAALLRADARRARRALPATWHRASRRRLRAWM